MPYESLARRRLYQRQYYKQTIKPRRERATLDTGAEKKLLVHLRLPTAMIGRIQRIVNEGIAMGTYPWKTQTAAIQALIMKGLESMSGDETIDDMLPYLRTIHASDSITQHRNEAQAAYSKIKTETSELLAIKAHDEAVAYFHTMYENVENMNAHVWRDWLLKQLRTSFPDLLKEKPKTPLFSKEDIRTERRERRDTKRKKTRA